jgi:hypothetical protein
VKHWFSSAGLVADARPMSSHGLRAGAATHLGMNDATDKEIAESGRWRPDSPIPRRRGSCSRLFCCDEDVVEGFAVAQGCLVKAHHQSLPTSRRSGRPVPVWAGQPNFADSLEAVKWPAAAPKDVGRVIVETRADQLAREEIEMVHAEPPGRRVRFLFHAKSRRNHANSLAVSRSVGLPVKRGKSA